MTRQGRRTARHTRTALSAALIGAVVCIAAAGCTGSGAVPAAGAASPRNERWQADIAYLARELPMVRAGGLGAVRAATWSAAARRLEAQVPRLTDGQVVAGMARLVAMIGDDETQVQFPAGPVFPFDAQPVGGGLYLLAVPADDQALLGTQILAVDGHPVAQILAAAATVIGGEDPQLRADEEDAVLSDGGLLQALGLTRSASAEQLTVSTSGGRRRTVQIAAHGTGFIGMPAFYPPGTARPPLPLYEQNAGQAYWLRVLGSQHAVYLKYNQCVPDSGFQRLVGQALALLRSHPDYRLIIDLRGNLGGDSAPFESLTSAMAADQALRGRVIGLVNQFTDSSATVDAQSLKEAGGVLIGQPPADPLDTWGDEQTITLPKTGLVVQYTTTQVNVTGTRMGLPDVTITPTLAQVLAGDDPVLTAALSYRAG
jgi:hypothetical protein